MKKAGREKGVLAATVVTTAMVLAFKVLGFVKQMVIAYYFGATQSTDVYFVASEFVAGLAEAVVYAISFSTLSIYTTVRVQEGREKASELITALFEVFVPLSVAAVGLFQCFAPQLAVMLAPSYTGAQRMELAGFIRMMSFMFMFVAFELLCSSVLDSERKFTIPRLKSLCISAGGILACVFLSQRLGVLSLAVGQYAANIVYLAMLIFGIRKYIRIRPVRPWKCPHIKRILTLAVPLFIGNSIVQINQIVDKTLSTGLGEGTASALTYCHVLSQFVTTVLVVNIGNVLFAHFSNYVAQKEIEKVGKTLNTALTSLTYVLAPIALITVTCAEEIVRIIYYRGGFTLEAVRLTSLALVGYGLSFVFVGVRDLLTKSMYAYQDTRSPMINSSIGICTNIVTSIVLSRYIGILGIAIGTSVSACVSMGLNMRSFRKKLADFSYRPLLTGALRCLPGLAAMLAPILLLKRLQMSDMLCFVLSILLGGFVYGISLYLQRVPEAMKLAQIVRRRLKR